jgi:hypothetical protein
LNTREEEKLVPKLINEMIQVAYVNEPFNHPNCIAPVLNLLQVTVLYGAPEMKKQAVAVLIDIVRLANENALKPNRFDVCWNVDRSIMR